MQEENKRMAQEKRDRESAWRNNQQKQNKFEITHVDSSDFMQENPTTTIS